jgi:sodium/potassium/calcium exchanger 6
MNQLLSFLQPAVRKQPRYSTRPFYTTLFIFTILATASWLFSATGKEHGQFTQAGTAAGINLLKREDQPEVSFPPLSCEMRKG